MFWEKSLKPFEVAMPNGIYFSKNVYVSTF